jgi:hypothetical protein
MATVFYGISGDIGKKIDKWIDIAGIPDVFSENAENLHRHTAKLLGKYDVLSLDEALKRHPDAEVWVTYRKANNTARALLKHLPPERIHFLEADLEYRKGCRYLGNFISYRKNSFSPCCVTGKAPIVPTSGSIRQRLTQWQDYTTDLVDNVRRERSNDCEKCHMLKYLFLEGVNDNEADIDGYYEIVKETGGIVMPTGNLNAPYTKKMRELALRVVQKAKADGIKVDATSGYLNPGDAKFIAESYAGA